MMNNLDELHKYILTQIEYHINIKENDIRQLNTRPYLWLASNKCYQKDIKLNEQQVITIVTQLKKLSYDEIRYSMLKFEQIMCETKNIMGNEVYIIALNIFKEYEIIRTIESVINIRKDSNSSIRSKNKIFQLINTIMRPLNLPSGNLIPKIKRSTAFIVTRKILDK